MARDSSPLALPVLGFPVEFASNDDRVLSAVRSAFGFWDHIAVPQEQETVKVNITVGAGPLPGSTVYCEVAKTGLLRLRGAGLEGRADRDHRRANCTMVAGWLDHREVFRKQVLEALTLFLLTGERRVPVHASAVVLDGLAAILLGASGSGKTTLAYACATLGLGVLAEDIVYLDPTDGHRIWGAVSRFHLLPDLVGEYPELQAYDPHPMEDGTRKLIVEPSADNRATVPVDSAVVCVLRSGRDVVAWRSLPAEEIGDAFAASEDPGFDLHEQRPTACLAHLARHGCVELDLSGDSRAGAAGVEQILRIHSKLR